MDDKRMESQPDHACKFSSRTKHDPRVCLIACLIFRCIFLRQFIKCGVAAKKSSYISR